MALRARTQQPATDVSIKEDIDGFDNGSSRASLDGAAQSDAPSLLTIDGLVAMPRAFAPEDLASLTRISCTEDFFCDHKGTAPEQIWSGISLLEIIQLAQPRAEAKYLRIHAQNYTIPLALAEIKGALLADSLNGQRLSIERGAPWRLYVPGAECHVSVKWVNRLELSATRGSTPEERIARARQRGRLAANAS